MSYNFENYDIAQYVPAKTAYELLQVTKKTLYSYCKKGLIRRTKVLGNSQRYVYNKEDIYRLLNIKHIQSGMNVCYCRVSKSKNVEKLREQEALISNYAIQNGFKIDKIYSDIVYSNIFNPIKRPKLYELIRDMASSKIKCVYILSPDRICRFGNELFIELCTLYKVKVVFLSDDQFDSIYKDEVREEITQAIRFIRLKHNI